jgi:hypothetical protein
MAELVDVHNPSERQLKFRAEYQAQIHPLYQRSRPYRRHLRRSALRMIGWCLSRLQGATWEWLLVVPVFFFSNLFEWWIHKYVMHRLVDVWALRAIYDRHTRQHHQYFTDNEMTVTPTANGGSSSFRGARCSRSWRSARRSRCARRRSGPTRATS